MKRKMFSFFGIILFLFILSVSVYAVDDQSSVILPENLKVIHEEAFLDDQELTSVVIPKNVQIIEGRAFANCKNLEEVYFGKNKDVQIAKNAFEGCEDVHFYVYPETAGELYVLSHGYVYDLLEEGNAFLTRALSMVTANGGTASVLQSSDFTAKRLICRMRSEYLPDISDYNPIDIAIDEGNIFFIQFGTVADTVNCYTTLRNNSNVIFVEADSCMDILGDVSAAGTVDNTVWDTEDPMGFDTYASFVAKNGTGKVTISVIDSGVSRRSGYSSLLREDGINLTGDGEAWSYDPLIHGSAIAAVIKDCVGAANVDILPVRVVSSNGVANLTMIGLGIRYAIEHGADIINLSLNFEENAYVTYWLDRAADAGVTVVVAAGNNARDIARVYPANVNNVVTVSGIDHTYELSATSNFGNNVSYCAPDSYVTASAFPGIIRRGTSFSAPMIASALALEKLDSYHTLQELRDTCRDLGLEGKDSAYGYGLPQLAELANIYTESVQLDSTTPNQMAVGEKIELKWTVLPDNATDKTVTVTSSNENVIRIERDDEGSLFIEAMEAGNALITVSANNGIQVSTSAQITVIQPVTKLTIQRSKDRIAVGYSLPLSVLVEPENATSKAVIWKSLFPDIASVSEDGVVTGLAPGVARIIVRPQDGYGGKPDLVYFMVVDIPDPEEIQILVPSKDGEDPVDVTNGHILLKPGEQQTLMAAVLPEEADQEVVWSCNSNPESAITIDQNGLIQATELGNAIITVTAVNGIQTTVEVESAVLPQSMSIIGNNYVDIGTPVGMTIEFQPDDTSLTEVTWRSSNTAVATVDQTGKVTGVSSGTATIFASSKRAESVTASKTITVRQPYSLKYNANGGTVSPSGKTAYSGYAVGSLPTPTLDYYSFDGWYTAASGGTRVTASTVLEANGEQTIYAHWTQKPLSGWVYRSEVPANASIIETKTETQKSRTTNSISGWTLTGSSWVQVGSGSVKWANLGSVAPGFDTGHYIFGELNNTEPTADNNGSSKREVNRTWSGYVYWHWMYDCGGANGSSERAIFNKYGSGVKWFYKYFGAFYDATNYTGGDTGYCNNLGIRNYIVPGRTAYADCQGATRWFRFDYYTTYYTDYQMEYTFQRELVRYREK